MGRVQFPWLCRPIAHRGLHNLDAKVIENSRSAVKAAMAKNFAIEVDLQPDCDGNPMVFHDETLDRLTNSSGRVDELSVSELRSISYRISPDTILALEDLLTIVGGKVPLIVEIKSMWRDQHRFVEKIVAKFNNYDGKFALMSFDPAIMMIVKSLAPDICRGLVAERFRDTAYWKHLSWGQKFVLKNLLWSFRVQPHFVAYNIADLPTVGTHLFSRILRRPLLTWTVRTEADKRRALKYADAMIFEGFVP